MNTPYTDTELRHARRRVKAKRGWFIHAFFYVCVNSVLWLLASKQGLGWNVWPLMGWGIGLAFHTLAVWVWSEPGGCHDKAIAREAARLRKRTRQ